MFVSLDQSELNTILAALRHYQATPEDAIPKVIKEIADPDGAPLSLDADEIDELCCRLNFGESSEEPAVPGNDACAAS